MSWFDTSGLASIAKSALKEAQRTIDKALDIRDEDSSSAPVNTPVDPNSDDFFGSWGLTQSQTVSTKEPQKDKQVEHDKVILRNPNMATSLWGSFTGSFFEVPNKEENIKPRDSVESLDDSIDINEHFRSSKLVVQSSEDGEGGGGRFDDGVKRTDEILDFLTGESSPEQSSQTFPSTSSTASKRQEKPSNNQTNRLSVISTGSGRNSSESVEILTGTGCTNTPESELLSITQSLSTSSSVGHKQTSDSVEVIFEGVTTPSSVEVIESENTQSDNRRLSQYTDEFVSPLQSPQDATNSFPVSLSPDSVEVIPDDQEETSLAEDTASYTSISESTATTIQEPSVKVLYKTPIGLQKTQIAETIPIVRPPIKSSALTIPVKAAGLAISTTSNTKQLIDQQPQSYKQDLSSLLKNYNVIDIPLDSDSLKSTSPETTMVESNDEGSQSDKTIIASSEGIMESSSDTSTTTDSNTNSLYLKTMLADAMTERDKSASDTGSEKSHAKSLTKTEAVTNTRSEINTKTETEIVFDSTFDSTKSESFETISASQLEIIPREASPLSSESKSDLVKIGSDHTSGHTSGDELETTTSSDIEIISSPNGDSSSTHSRHSPAKLSIISQKQKTGDPNVDILLEKMTFKKIKGHNRELSEASTVSDDSEVDRLIRRINEMTEILESREAKLIEVSRKYIELQESNNDLKHQLDIVLNKQIESSDLSQVTEEYTQRLSALERKFQQAIREKDSLRKQLDHAKQEAAVRISKGEIETLISEKDETIKQLREEGEKLSKQQLQHSNIIKKLRAKEKDNESTIKHLREKVEELSAETERLKKTLAAKEDVERTQIEAVHQLTAKTKKLEKDNSQYQSELEDLNVKHDTIKKSFDAARSELVDKNRANTELHAKEQMVHSLENEKRILSSQMEEVMSQLEDLRHRLQESDAENLRKEEIVRSENGKLLRRLEEAERRNEELSQSVLEVSKPLVFQIDSLQATYNKKITSFEKTEQQMNMKINDLQSRLQSTSVNEKLYREECMVLKQQISEIEATMCSVQGENEVSRIYLEKVKTELSFAKNELERKVSYLEKQLSETNEKIEVLDRENEILQHKLKVEAEKKIALTQETVQQASKLHEQNSLQHERSSPQGDNASPTPSIGRASIADSFASSFWPPDEPFETIPSARCTNMLEVQLLQTSLRQREGEVQQFQWELNRREHERTILNTEISDLMTRIENLEGKLANHETLTTQYEELQSQYDTLCQLYGEKVEETEELKLDLQDVKEMYKIQIDELLKQQKESS